MILDTSTLVAILYREPEAVAFAQRIHVAAICRISVANHAELSMVIENRLGPERCCRQSVLPPRSHRHEPLTVDQGELARQAFSISARAATRPG